MNEQQHSAFRDDLVLYALGEADAENPQLKQHLKECRECAAELRAVNDSIAAVALSAASSAPPARSRQRLLDAIHVRTTSPAKLSAAMPHVIAMRRPWWAYVPYAAAVLLAAFSMMLWTNNLALRQHIAALEEATAGAQSQLHHAQLVIDGFTSPTSQKVMLVSAKQKPQAAMNVMYMREHRAVVLVAHNIPMPPAGKAYELWIIPANGGAPMPAGLCRPDKNGYGMITTELASAPPAKSFAVTVEPEAGSSAPTSAIIMSGE